jgi:hypothetical protein
MVRAIILILLPVVFRTAFETAEKRPQAIPELRARLLTGLRRVFGAVEEVHRFLVFLISMAIIEKAITIKIPAKMNKPLIQIIVSLPPRVGPRD